MEFWFSEKHTPNVKMSIRVDRPALQRSERVPADRCV